MKSKEERLKKNTQDLMVFLFSQEIYKKKRELLYKIRKTEEIENDYIT